MRVRGFFPSKVVIVVPASTRARDAKRCGRWNPTQHSRVKSLFAFRSPVFASPESFSRLRDAPNNAQSVRSLVNKTQKLSPDLQISKEEAKRITPLRKCWRCDVGRGRFTFGPTCLTRSRACFRLRRHGSSAVLRSHRPGDPPERRDQRAFAPAGKDSPAIFLHSSAEQELVAEPVRESRRCIGNYFQPTIKVW